MPTAPELGPPAARRWAWAERFDRWLDAPRIATTLELGPDGATSYRAGAAPPSARLVRPTFRSHRGLLLVSATFAAYVVVVALTSPDELLRTSATLAVQLALLSGWGWLVRRVYPPSVQFGRDPNGLWLEQSGVRRPLGRTPAFETVHVANGLFKLSLVSGRERLAIAAGPREALDTLEAQLKEHLDLGAPPAMRVETEEPAAEDSAATGARTRRRA